MTFILGASALCALIYGALFCNAAPSTQRVVIKVGATALLTLWAYLMGAPVLIVAALAFSTLGDGFLGASEEKYLLPGMGAFFVAHAAYIPLFWDHAADTRHLAVLAAQVAVTISGAVYLRSLMPWLEKSMRLPVLAYTIIILLMVNAAMRLDPAMWVAAVGAIAFAASDTLLSVELFRLKPNAPVKPVIARAVWFLYYGGQAAIAWAFIQAAA
ncbi:MAG: lysoplasmalogenase [Henriciella sp.]|nr:lysoplasmalogenase [Henriciella sp.]MBO6694235.1 lysoplasmalogenase [Henriciella sp.]